jgi:hypothetical protein
MAYHSSLRVTLRTGCRRIRLPMKALPVKKQAQFLIQIIT